MADLTSPVTGGAQVGLTSPTYTIEVDSPPSLNAKQWYVSALGGTQSGVNTHSVSSPFTVSLFRPAVLKQLTSAALAALGTIDAPKNTYKIIVRKGGTINAVGGKAIAMLKVEYEIPANMPDVSHTEIAAMFSIAQGVFDQMASQMQDQVLNGTV